MKYNILFSFCFLIVLVACQQESTSEKEVIPTDLAGKKEYLKKKKVELRELNRVIAKVEGDINELAPPAEKTKKLVSIMPLVKKDFNRFVEIQAEVQSDDIVSASSEVGGRIIHLNVKEGQAIRKGQLVARVDLEQIDKQEAELRKGLELAVDLFERQSRLWKENIGSEVQYLQAKNNKERIEKTLETLSFQKKKANVYAPISGVIDQEFIKKGEMASPGMPIVQILNTSKVKVVADVPESYLGTIKKGETVAIKFPAINEEVSAKVSQLGRSINPANRTFEVEVNLSNRKGLLKPNLLALMLINDLSVTDAVVVPIDLVQQEVSGKQYVYISDEEGGFPIAKKTYVEIGESYEGEIIILDGLTGDETLITDGARGLSDGEFIEISGGEEAGTSALTKK